MSIQVGQTVPDIALDAFVWGEPEPRGLTLAGRGGRWIVLLFYPSDFTTVCPSEISAFAELDERFGAEQADLIAASSDTFRSYQAGFAGQPELAGVRFPVIADTTRALSEAFGVLGADGAVLPGTFLIDTNGVIRHASRTHTSSRASPDETLRTLQTLRRDDFA